MNADLANIPQEISRANQHDIQILWMDGHISVFPARSLRLDCACAACVHEMTGARLLNPLSIPADVHPQKIVPVGRYAIQIFWSDLHSTGIYTYDRLRALCPCSRCSSGRAEAPPTRP